MLDATMQPCLSYTYEEYLEKMKKTDWDSASANGKLIIFSYWQNYPSHNQFSWSRPTEHGKYFHPFYIFCDFLFKVGSGCIKLAPNLDSIKRRVSSRICSVLIFLFHSLPSNATIYLAHGTYLYRKIHNFTLQRPHCEALIHYFQFRCKSSGCCCE